MTLKPRKTRAKKDEAVAVHEDEHEQETEAPPPPPSKFTRGRKRGSEEMEDSVLTNAEAPAPKKRATKASKTRASNMTEASQADIEMADASAPVKKPAARRGRKPSATRSARRMSAMSTASSASLRSKVPNDDEIDRQLQADLERPLTEDENILADSDSERKRASLSRRKEESKKAANEEDELHGQTATTDFAMFDPAPVEVTEAEVEADFKTLEGEMESDEELEEIKVPRKGRPAGTRKASKQTAAKKTKKVSLPAEDPPAAADSEEPDEIAEADVSIGSNNTVVRTSIRSRVSTSSNASIGSTAKRGRPSKKSKLSQGASDEPSRATVIQQEPEVESMPEPEPAKVNAALEPIPVKETVKRASSGTGKRGRPSKKSKLSDAVLNEPVSAQPSAREEPAAAAPTPISKEVEAETATAQDSFSTVKNTPARVERKPVPARKNSPARVEKALPRLPPSQTSFLDVPATPRHKTSPVQSAKQATVSPSPSPQASDAENQPPSTQPTDSRKRVPLGALPVTATPMRNGSPSKRQNVIGGLQSTVPWTAVDLNLVLEDLENIMGDSATDRFFAKGAELTSPEKNMTVEEWIYYNAGQAEQKLKYECEAMVTAFEKEGTRAMHVLEGLVVE